MKKSSIIILTGLALLVSSCGSKGGSGSPSANRGTTLSTASSTVSDMQTRVQHGSVYDPNGDATNLQTQVSNLVSASADPNSIGSVSAQGSVFFGAKVVLSGTTVSSTSELEIQIKDSYVGSYNVNGQMVHVTPYTIDVKTASGTIANGQITNLVFQDSYGQIILNGTYDNSTVTGTISYINNRYFDGSQAPLSGTLGQFKIDRCSFFRCQ